MSRFKNKAGNSENSGEGRLIFIRPADLARAGFSGVVAEGRFEEAMQNKFDESKEDFKIVADVKILVKGEDKNGNTYEEDINPGDTVVVNGAGNLNYFMREVSPGDLCQINYLGKLEIKKGERKGTLAHNFEVYY